MESTNTIKHAVMAGALAATAWACGPSGPTSELVDARRAYQRAQASPAATYTPDELLTARQALDRAEGAHEDDPGSDEEAHLAYLAARKSQIASAHGEMVQSKQAEAKAKANYQAMLESNQGALAQTQGELDQARSAQMEAEAAQERMAAELEKIAMVKKGPGGLVITLSGNVLFPTGGDTLSPSAEQTLDRLATALKEHPDLPPLAIEGHADSSGNAKSNEALSERRAQAVADYLASVGLERSRIQAIGHGEEQPIASNDTAEGRASNRRVEIVLNVRQGAAAEGATMGAAPGAPTPGEAAKELPEKAPEPSMEPMEPMEPLEEPTPPSDIPQE